MNQSSNFNISNVRNIFRCVNEGGLIQTRNIGINKPTRGYKAPSGICAVNFHTTGAEASEAEQMKDFYGRRPEHFKSVQYEVKDNVAYITLNRPKRYNAIDENMPPELETAVALANWNDSVKVIFILTLSLL